MENLMSQMQKVLHERPQGALPNNNEPNPRDQVNLIMTRNGLTTVEPSIPPHVSPTPRGNLMDVLTQIPTYTKVLKDSLKNNEKLEELANTPINAKFSALLLNKVPEKLGGPEKFLIPCVLQDLEVCNSLANSGASINLMPLLIYEKLRVGPLKPTQMTLDWLTDLVPIILGRPFLRTAKALIDLYEEKLTLKIGNEELVFRSENFSKNSPSREHHSVHSINIIDSLCEEISNQNKQNSGRTTSHYDDFLPAYEAFCFDIKEKSSGSTISHYDLSLLEYDSFHFDLSIDPLPPVDRSDSQHEEFADELAHIISPPEYDHFYFNLEADPGEFTRVLKKNISETLTKDLKIHELNDFPLLLSDCDFTFTEEFSKIDLLVSFPSGNKDKIFDPRIFIIKRVQSQRFHILSLDDFSTISFVSDSLFLTDPSEIETFLSFYNTSCFRSLYDIM
ncbi:hypothetical protein Tco_0908676 [Tanacetum coccineum]|uniref:Reverse transcriptase domain-containing protein n=1 Tax=Tanacetum coccineum TaxID=301880 RepID=A0ABQ5CMU0_9ASTR